VTIYGWLNFGYPAPQESGSAAGRKFLTPPYYNQRAMFASLGALFFIQLCDDNGNNDNDVHLHYCGQKAG